MALAISRRWLHAAPARTERVHLEKAVTRRTRQTTGTSMVPCIYTAGMKVGNKTHEAAFLAPLPVQVRDEVSDAVSNGDGTLRLRCVWDGEARRDFYLASDGETVLCLTVASLTYQQAMKVRAEFARRNTEDPTVQFSPATFVDILRGLGHHTERVS